MPIPPIDGIICALPPHVGDPRLPDDVSPYRATTVELCTAFGTSKKRKLILAGFLDLRGELRKKGAVGFQWIDGSFLEDIETLASRSPRDIDVVTFAIDTQLRPFGELSASVKSLGDRNANKKKFKTDHFFVDLRTRPDLLVEVTSYWYGLFSHRRDATWKGMVRIELSHDTTDDDAATKVIAPPKNKATTTEKLQPLPDQEEVSTTQTIPAP
jgi:hypothetical protein